ncbi:family 16 glycosylhydrolase [Curtobacterium sp. Csp1]|uniref:glycoside hydrolase family 16 protein n=1 Tax=Curtobacterium sp. Csp1 TaxID=2495429 RepID=UPI0020C69778|nr:glycoside hydrolase family 16 protein [Curtobacterium sp. Csp1]
MPQHQTPAAARALDRRGDRSLRRTGRCRRSHPHRGHHEHDHPDRAARRRRVRRPRRQRPEPCHLALRHRRRQELETYTDSRREPDGTFTSARLKTEGTFTAQYGRVEARIKIPRGQGIWPAFWMLGADIGQVGWPACGEIDVMENVGYEPTIVHATVHGPGYSGANGLSAACTNPTGAAFADDFHVFGVDWRPDSITWLVDGVERGTVTRAAVGTNPWVFDKPFFVVLNVAVGGTWPGSPDATTRFPQQMLVDWVRVWQLG